MQSIQHFKFALMIGAKAVTQKVLHKPVRRKHALFRRVAEESNSTQSLLTSRDKGKDSGRFSWLTQEELFPTEKAPLPTDCDGSRTY